MEDQLISFALAKLAKEKGFEGGTNSCRESYRELNGELIKNGLCETVDSSWRGKYNSYTWYYAPTQSLLQKWIREIHKLDIEIETYWKDEFKKETVYQPWVKFKGSVDDNNNGLTLFPTYEQALESALEESLNLINNA